MKRKKVSFFRERKKHKVNQFNVSFESRGERERERERKEQQFSKDRFGIHSSIESNFQFVKKIAVKFYLISDPDPS